MPPSIAYFNFFMKTSHQPPQRRFLSGHYIGLFFGLARCYEYVTSTGQRDVIYIPFPQFPLIILQFRPKSVCFHCSIFLYNIKSQCFIHSIPAKPFGLSAGYRLGRNILLQLCLVFIVRSFHCGISCSCFFSCVKVDDV